MAIQQVDLVGNSGRPVVTPQATEQLAGAFRSGFISADDIMERVSERTRAKQELELVTAQQGIAEATDPALIQAKKNQQLLAGDQAQQTRDLLPLARRATEEKLFGDIRSGQVARYGIKEKLSALNDVGFAPAPDKGGEITSEYAMEVNRRFGKLIKLQKRKSDAVFGLATVDAGDVVVGGATYRGPMDKLTGAPGDDRQVKQWRKDAAMTLPEFLLEETPGEVVAPVTALPAAQTASLIQPMQQPVAQVAPLVQPMQPAAQAIPIVQPAQPAGVPPGFTQVKAAPVVAENVKRTDALQRELVALNATSERIADTRKLAVYPNIGADQYQWVQAKHRAAAAVGITDWNPFFENKNKPTERQIYIAQDRLNNAIADEIATYAQDWKGAISNVELNFFKEGRPKVSSEPEAWKFYLDRVDKANEAIKKVVAGELAPADPAAWAANPRSALGATGATLPAAPTGAPPASPSAAPVFTLTEASAQPSGTVFKDANGNWRRKL